jgi:hypothetical protein
MLLDVLPKLRILLHFDFSAGVQLIEAAEIHVLGQQRDDIGVESLPVRILQMVSISEWIL